MIHAFRFAALAAASLCGLLAGCTAADGTVDQPSDPSSPPTFTRDIAPIIFNNCSGCHRPGESGPFDLLDYEDVKKRSKQIVEVTASRYMPPWLPEPGHGEFEGARGLDDGEIDRIQRWVTGGMPEGPVEELPELPQWTDGWQLGPPDLVVQMAESYILPADGIDVFRNFVIPLPVDRTRYVKTVELRPGNKKVVHHGVMRIDRTLSSRRLAEQDPELGFGSMNMGDAIVPDGHAIDWTPGMTPNPGLPGLAWRLQKGTDAVVQLHMLPSGKLEEIRPTIGLYLADEPPTRELFGLMLHSRGIDIPPGEKSYVVEDSYDVAVDLEIYSVYPHAHYLGKKMEGYATLPDGSRKWLILIEDWDFNWQDVYRYVEPISIPAGSTLQMRFTYDNSADNVRNPNFPPKRVVEGSQSTDEMGTLSYEVLARDAADLDRLKESLARQDIAKQPGDWLSHQNLALVLQLQGRLEEAMHHLQQALRYNPTRTEALNSLGLILSSLGRTDEAIERFRRAIEINPYYVSAHNNLALAYYSQGRFEEAQRHLRAALELSPFDAGAHYNLGTLLQRMGKLEQATEHLREALRVTPDSAEAHNNLGNVLAAREEWSEAAEHYRRATELDPQLADVRGNLANVLLMQGALDEAIGYYREELRINPGSEDARYNLEIAMRMRAERAER